MRYAPAAVVIISGIITAYICFHNSISLEGEVHSFRVVEDKKSQEVSTQEHTFEDIWPTLQDKLCPNYEPRHKLGIRLFMAARREVNIEELNFDAGNELDFYYGYFEEPKDTYVGHHDETALFEYVRIWKGANRQIVRWLEKTFHKVESITSSSSPQTCIFTAIRDPISHFLSGYNEVESRNENIPRQRVLSYRSSQKGSPERFIAYVIELLTSPQFGKYKIHRHSYSMSRILGELKKNGKRLTGYLPSLENITSTLPPFLDKTCPGILNEEEIHHEMEVMGQHLGSKDPYKTYAAAKSVWDEKGSTARALCALHAMDYACWRDLPGGVPQLCQEVYSSKSFLELMEVEDSAQ